MLQLSASIEKSWLEKRRNIRVTICECCSHLLILGILYLGYGLSIVAYYPEKVYDSIQIEFPPAGIAGNAAEITSFMSGPLPIVSLDTFVTASQLLSSLAGKNRFISALEATQFGRRYGNLLKDGALHFAPYPSEEVDSLLDYMNKTMSSYSSISIYTHPTEEDATQYIIDHLDEEWTLALIVLREVSPRKINYVIRQSYETVPSTALIVNQLTIGLDNTYQKYSLGGYFSIQDSIDRWAFEYLGISNSSSPICQAPPTTLSMPFPTAAYSQNPFYPSVGFLLGLAFTMSMVYPVARLVKTIVEEKELRQRELSKIMGLHDWTHGLAWWLTSFILFFWIAISSTPVASGFLPKTNSTILFTYFFLFGMSAISLSFLVAVFFTNSKLAAIVAPVVLASFILPKYIFFNTNSNQSLSMKILASVLSPTAFTFGADVLSAYEYAGVGVQFANLNSRGYNLNICFGMLVFDSFLYGFLAWYLDNILQHEVGIAKHPLFFLMPSYYFGNNVCACPMLEGTHVLHGFRALSNPDLGMSPMEHVPPVGNENFEPIPANLQSLIKMSLQSVWKKYPDGKIAVKGISLDVLEGQITCLLGHNGAGKSTTISMLTGMTPVTCGDCEIYGHRLSDGLSSIRQITGICPQQNIIFPALTVREHLKYFGAIKGMSLYCGSLADSADQILHEVGLYDKRNSPAFSLSGGMKRKLCLAMALIGDPRLIILDEPTSGMDPCSRRAVWDLLQRKKAGRIILLTTHFMDEADIISDRIAIMSDGVIRCVGSSLFLKNRFGAGYVLTIAKTELNLGERNTSGDKESCSTVDHCGLNSRIEANQLESERAIVQSPAPVNTHSITSQAEQMFGYDSITIAITGVIPDAFLRSTAAGGGELVYHLPFSCAPHLPILFQYLKEHASQLGIISYGVSITSLEQVFIKLAREQQQVDPSFASESQSSVWQSLMEALRTVLTASYHVSLRRLGLGSRRTEPLNPASSPVLELPRIVSDHVVGEVGPGNSGSNFGNNITPSDQTDEHSSSDCTFEQVRPGITCNQSTMLGGYQTQIMCNDSTRLESNSQQISPGPVENGTINDSTALEPATLSIPNPSNEKLFNVADEFDSSISSSQTSVQLLELLRKRFIVASRDIKGLFFQIIFPAMQILLVLAILTIRLNPAGPTLRLSAYSYLVQPTVLLGGSASVESSGNQASATVVGNLSSDAMALFDASFCLNSSEMSRFLLDEFQLNADLQPIEAQQSIYLDDHSTLINTNLSTPSLRANAEISRNARRRRNIIAGDRYGSFVTNDVVQLNLTVNWEFIKQNAEAFTNATNSTQLIVNYLDKHYFPWSIEIRNLNLTALNISFFPLGIGDMQFSTANASDIVIKSIENALNRANITTVNETALELFIDRIFLVLANTTADITFSQEALQNVSLAFSAQHLRFDAESNSVVFVDSYLIVDAANSTMTFNLGNVTLSIPTIIALLPSGRNRYFFPIESAYSVMHNASSPHAVAIFNAELKNAYFRACSPSGNAGLFEGESQSSPVYVAKNHPLPITSELALELRIILSFITSLFILIPLCFIPAAFVAFVVKERACKSKHLQLVSSINPNTYWLATYIWDMCMFTILAVLIVAVSALYGLSVPQSFISSTESGVAVFTLLMLYGFSVIPLCYLYSFLFENPSTCQISVTIVNFVTGFILVLAYFIMISVPSTYLAGTRAVHFFRFFPPYNIGEGLIQINVANYQNSVLNMGVSPFEWTVTGRNIVFMAVEALGFFCLVLLVESPLIQNIRSWIDMERVTRANASIMKNPLQYRPLSSPLGETNTTAASEGVDIDVYEEENLVRSILSTRKSSESGNSASHRLDQEYDGHGPQSATNEDYVLLLSDLQKIYPPSFLGGQAKYAVQGLSLAIKPGERFGFLGVNGAGKSTTLGILTGDICRTRGVGFIAGESIASAGAKLCLGLCPQEDPLLDQMNAYETLWFFGRIRGIPQDILTRRIRHLIQKVGLEKYAHRVCGNYSGGNKRKLSLAVALIGNPKLLLLDEPSSGMDPEARRHMWDVISAVSADRSVILTTHSMEECEALCSRVGIMVQGKLQCLGTSHHLKTRFGKGYEVQLRCTGRLPRPQNCFPANSNEDDVRSGVGDGNSQDAVSQNSNGTYSVVQAVCVAFREVFPSAVVKESHGLYVCLRCDNDIALDVAFGWLEARKRDEVIFDYSVSETSLEQIFVEFAQSKNTNSV